MWEIYFGNAIPLRRVQQEQGQLTQTVLTVICMGDGRLQVSLSYFSPRLLINVAITVKLTVH